MSWFSKAFRWFFGAAKDLFSKAWNLALPFFKEILRQSAAQAFASLQELAIEAVQYVAVQGLPTDEAKQKAFKEYMTQHAKEEVGVLKDYELNLLRETAYAIWKKATGQP